MLVTILVWLYSYLLFTSSSIWLEHQSRIKVSSWKQDCLLLTSTGQVYTTNKAKSLRSMVLRNYTFLLSLMKSSGYVTIAISPRLLSLTLAVVNRLSKLSGRLSDCSLKPLRPHCRLRCETLQPHRGDIAFYRSSLHRSPERSCLYSQLLIWQQFNYNWWFRIYSQAFTRKALFS